VPLREQVAIADFLDNEGLALDRAIRKAQDELRLMQDYRTRLIADVVTGKLDVRKAAAALPNELEAAEPDAEELLDEGEVEDDAELDTESEESEA
jgi:type I restriction enzyme S subunit